MCLDEALGAFCRWTKRTFGDVNRKIEFLGKGTVVRMRCGVVNASNAGEGTSQGISTALLVPILLAKLESRNPGGKDRRVYEPNSTENNRKVCFEFQRFGWSVNEHIRSLRVSVAHHRAHRGLIRGHVQ
jgi:hypothetical protein